MHSIHKKPLPSLPVIICVQRNNKNSVNQLIVTEEWKRVKSGHYLEYTSGWNHRFMRLYNRDWQQCIIIHTLECYNPRSRFCQLLGQFFTRKRCLLLQPQAVRIEINQLPWKVWWSEVRLCTNVSLAAAIHST